MVLFVNGCVREESRTLELAKAVLEKLPEDIEEILLYPDGPDGLDAEELRLREKLVEEQKFDHPMLQHARQFAAADTIVIAAPY